MVRRIAILFLSAMISGAVAGDRRPSDEGEASRFRVSSEMVLVNASVVDSRGRPISGLSKENFRLFENHAEKKIAWFSEDQAPVSMVIVFDTSGSMEGKLNRCAEAVAELLRSSQTGDEFALVTFSNQPQLVRAWTRDEAAVPAALLNARAHGTTAVIDALHMAGRYANTGANPRKLLFVLSDGGDNSSRWREPQVLRQLQELDLELYAVDIRESGFTPPYPGVNEGPGLLDRMCDGLSGRYIAVERMGDLADAVERIRREIRSQYVLGYRPGALERDGRFHPVEVKVAPPAGMHRITVRWRRGWREPQGEGAVE
ncbi:MAG: VWA domain-containing protein [Bryobacteraceae bacterium]|jgi:VWFA-related protein